MKAYANGHSLNPLRKVFPIFTMPEPTGRYGIGTFEHHLIDEQRSETKRGTLPTENPKRREVPITVWYPTLANDVEGLEPEYYPDSLGECISLVFRLPKLLFRHLSQVKTHTFRDIPLANDLSSYPVLLFSPGIRSTRFQSLTLIEELVSRGYIVVGMDHPYTSGKVTLADGNAAKYLHEPEFAKSRLLYDYNVKEIAVRAADASFVMDTLQQWNTSESGHLLSGKIDLNKVGIMGHSYGGATAVEATVNDERFSAALSLEGGFWGKVSHTPLERPFMYLFTGETAKSLNPDHPKKEAVFYTEWREDAEWVMTNSHSDTWFATVEPFYHQSFTDISLVSPKLFAKSLSPERMIEITRSYTTAFFDHHLKGISSELLERDDAKFPEVRYTPAYSQRRRD
ncbi:lipase [Saccharibacillus sp. JS10]|uniref:alpha/beta hydrolase family protein n=1 Tax=Saccharibacillus sp. JS10 TaxID=2950552 RepID=UPI00210BFE47|nr:lipase [Saccharibacillus sp. JS10]MCQ4088522.1 lipase [Saccharibacillus sp. JS10]